MSVGSWLTQAPHPLLNSIIQLYLVAGSALTLPVEVHQFDPVSDLTKFLEIKRPTFIHNGNSLVDAFSFSYYHIEEGDTIYAFSSPEETSENHKSRHFIVDECKPVILNTNLPGKQKSILYQYVCNKFAPSRARALAQICDNRFRMLEHNQRFSSYRHESTPELSTKIPEMNFAYQKASSPCEAQLPIIWENDNAKPQTSRSTVYVAMKFEHQ